VVLAGNAHVCRVGVSILTNVGLPELVAQTPEEYVRSPSTWPMTWSGCGICATTCET